ncbi:hypothetical protein AURANDRAFT_67402 [Aureococcus anophagefferens]|uniref:Uncharacterized protein n=1 Tax=Aureococcus anophagefferens TaxID=44056 RepID=F0YL09_AURAN|nr:hypothetical protein AURANDRAFT_67402 [Aureococcus anophagefferens]EGB04229.1 hypothetical protein AURANDRAFT_67402 [Aureococcus anophagefferens]|eukprot:XP_009041080.1 hypothetical protein AURANDRAFT_67402 [Aureococcus anophagefferens]
MYALARFDPAETADADLLILDETVNDIFTNKEESRNYHPYARIRGAVELLVRRIFQTAAKAPPALLLLSTIVAAPPTDYSNAASNLEQALPILERSHNDLRRPARRTHQRNARIAVLAFMALLSLGKVLRMNFTSKAGNWGQCVSELLYCMTWYQNLKSGPLDYWAQDNTNSTTRHGHFETITNTAA